MKDIVLSNPTTNPTQQKCCICTSLQALYVSERIDAGTCFVNTYNKTDVAAPFGGFKQSGFGKDLGQEALSEYLKTKTVTFEYNN